MAIQQKEYIDLKEYWDFQRKKEYNKERVFAMADKFEGRAFTEFGPVNIEEMKQMLWTKIPQSEYEDPLISNFLLFLSSFKFTNFSFLF